MREDFRLAEIQQARQGWLEAFKALRPAQPLPDLTYEVGWFVFRYTSTGRVPQRVRMAELWQMTRRLEQEHARRV